MFIAMNRFHVMRGSEDDFETIWRNRDRRLSEMDGFVSFQLLKGPEADDHTVFVSHTIWRDRASFEAWTRSEQFRHAHKDAGKNKPLYIGGPKFEGFDAVLEETAPAS